MQRKLKFDLARVVFKQLLFLWDSAFLTPLIVFYGALIIFLVVVFQGYDINLGKIITFLFGGKESIDENDLIGLGYSLLFVVYLLENVARLLLGIKFKCSFWQAVLIHFIIVSVAYAFLVGLIYFQGSYVDNMIFVVLLVFYFLNLFFAILHVLNSYFVDRAIQYIDGVVR